MQKHRKFIGNKRFYLMVLGVAMPIMIQNGITNFVSLLDNIMVGQVGTEQMSGVAIVNQLLFIRHVLTAADEGLEACLAQESSLRSISDRATTRVCETPSASSSGSA